MILLKITLIHKIKINTKYSHNNQNIGLKIRFYITFMFLKFSKKERYYNF